MASDPGGIFDSDAHRRVLGHLPLPGDEPTSLEDLDTRIADDEHTPNDELNDVLKDLEADGYAGETSKGWKQTKRGLDALNAPVPEED